MLLKGSFLNELRCRLLLFLLLHRIEIEVGAGGSPVGEYPEEGDAESCVYENKPAYDGEVEAEEIHLVTSHHSYAPGDVIVVAGSVGIGRLMGRIDNGIDAAEVREYFFGDFRWNMWRCRRDLVTLHRETRQYEL